LNKALEPNASGSKVDVLIVGAGAAGLMCAITAANRGQSVMLVDHANKVGKKILMSGGGRCNFTNLYAEPNDYLSNNPHFCKSALSRFTQWDFIALVDKHSIAYHEKTLGQLFCDNKSQDILQLLLDECQTAGVNIRAKCAVNSILAREGEGLGFTIDTSIGLIQSKSLVIATGGLSIPTMGATGFGYEIAKQFGLELLPVRAGLVPFTLQAQEKALFADLPGSSAKVRVSCNGMSFLEAMLFTHRGLSGPAILQISSYWNPGDTLTIDLWPEGSLEVLLTEQLALRPNAELKTVLAELYTKKMAACFCALWCESKPLNQHTLGEFQAIAEQFHNWQIKPSGTEGYRTAEVTLGGVNTDELSSKTMEAKKQPGLYFIGEVVDVTGHLGGFNFQWAWASGFAAGTYV